MQEAGVFDEQLLEGVERIVIVACGTSYHAGLIGRYAIEEWARIPVEMDIASEYRYRNPVIKAGDLVGGDLPIRRDRRYVGRDAQGPRGWRAGARDHERYGLTGHAGGRRGAVHAGRPRDRGGGHEDLRLSGRRDVPARSAARRSCGARLPDDRLRRAAGRHQEPAPADRGDGRDRLPGRRRDLPRAGRSQSRSGRSRASGPQPTSSSTSGAMWACRSHWRGP